MIKLKKHGKLSREERSLLNQAEELIATLPEPSLYNNREFNSKEEIKEFLAMAETSTPPVESPVSVNIEQPVKQFSQGGDVSDAEVVEDIPIPTMTGSAPQMDFDPLMEGAAIERSYTKEEQQTDFVIPPMQFDEPPVQSGQEQLNESEAEPSEEPAPQRDNSFNENVRNEYMNDMPRAEKEKSAAQLADTILGGYEMLHHFGKKIGKFPEEKLVKSIQDGEIDPTLQLPIDSEGTTATVQEYVEMHNENIEEIISYDSEWGAEVKPILTRVLAKRNWGMTDEQALAALFVKDLGTKSAMLFSMKKSVNMVLGAYASMSAQNSQVHQEEPVVEEPPLEPDSITKKEPESKPQKAVVPAEEIEMEFEEPTE